MSDVLRGAVPLPPDPQVWAARLARLRTPPPPPPAPPAPVGPQPCEVCHLPVTAEYIARTGRARHGHHPATEEP